MCSLCRLSLALVLCSVLTELAVAEVDTLTAPQTSALQTADPPAELSLNLLMNSDFENPPFPGAVNGADFWLPNPAYPITVDLKKSPTAHSGAQVLRLEPAKPGWPGVVYQFSRLQKNADRYILECYARGDGAKLHLLICEYGGKTLNQPETVVGTKYSEEFTLGSEWMRYRMEYRPEHVALTPADFGSGKDTTYVMYVAPSFYVVAGAAEVDDAQFIAVRNEAETVEKIEERPWRGNRLGISHSVPPPFSPVKAVSADKDERDLTVGALTSPFALRCWGRSYRFAQGPLPSDAISNGASMLAGPAAFRLSAGEAAPVEIAWRNNRMTECFPDSIKLVADGVASQGDGKNTLNLAVATTFEFDGMLRYDVTLQPKGEVTLDQFALDIPISPKHAELFHWQVIKDQDWRGHFGAFPAEYWHSTFSPTIWIGDHDRGLCWFAEAPRGWANGGAEERQIEIIPAATAKTLRINFINVPTTMDAPRTWTFGLLATPSKPLPDTPAKQIVHGLCLPAPSPCIRVEYILQSLECDPLQYHVDQATKTREQQLVQSTHDAGLLAVQWVQGQIVMMTPEYTRDAAQWMERPARTFRGSSIYYCQESEGWRDLLVYSLVNLVKEYGLDGVYLDTGISTCGCMNATHGCGYMDAEGRWRASYPIFGQREFKKRLYRALSEELGRQPYICTLVNGCYDFASLTFDTAILSGEEWSSKVSGSEDYRLACASLPAWEAQYCAGQWGVWPVFLPSSSSKPTTRCADSFLAYALLERTPLWVAYCDRKRVFAALEIIDALGPNVRFVPRWETDKYVRLSAEDCPATLYVAENQAVIVVSNFGDEAVQSTVNIKAQALGWNTVGIPTTDALDGAPLNGAGDRFAVTIPADGFRMIRITANP